MRILVTGFAAFVIWCFISSWLYNDILLPVIKKPVPVQIVPQPQSNVADSLAKIKASMPATLMIYFEFNDSRFKPDPQTDKSVAALKAWLEKYPSSLLTVTGHTDLVGTPEYNQDLGQKRAQIVAKYLESMGIAGNKMMIDSKGETEPAADYITEEGRAKNRRTEISIKMQ
jgi:outer membrane protein OmpA-like peptidoglycan-associated protein